MLFSLITFFISFSWAADPHPAKTDLLSDHVQVTRSQVIRLGWRFRLEKGWHVYWANAGDSGTPPKLKWEGLPSGVTVGELEWPLPERIHVGPLTNFGYQGEVIFPFEVTIKDFSGKKLELKATGKWLVCKEICIPGSAPIRVSLPLGSAEIKSLYSPLLHALPLPLKWTGELPKVSRAGELIKIEVSKPSDLPTVREVDFFPEAAGQLQHSVTVPWKDRGSHFELLLTPDSTLSKPLEKIGGLLVFLNDNGRVGYSLSALPITKEQSVVDSSLWQMALFALLGGLILNLMPCVFPVLSIKILGFVEQSKQSQQKVRIHGWMFVLGVMVSFWTLTAVLLILRAAGQKLGWGFNYSLPSFFSVSLPCFFSWR